MPDSLGEVEKRLIQRVKEHKEKMLNDPEYRKKHEEWCRYNPMRERPKLIWF